METKKNYKKAINQLWDKANEQNNSLSQVFKQACNCVYRDKQYARLVGAVNSDQRKWLWNNFCDYIPQAVTINNGKQQRVFVELVRYKELEEGKQHTVIRSYTDRLRELSVDYGAAVCDHVSIDKQVAERITARDENGEEYSVEKRIDGKVVKHSAKIKYSVREKNRWGFCNTTKQAFLKAMEIALSASEE